MTRITIALYVLALVALTLSLQVGWSASIVSLGAIAALVVLLALENRRAAEVLTNTRATEEARADALHAKEDVKRLRAEVQAALERLNRPSRGY